MGPSVLMLFNSVWGLMEADNGADGLPERWTNGRENGWAYRWPERRTS